MAIATNLPFSLSVIRTLALDKQGKGIKESKEATRFVSLAAANSLTETPTIFVKENEGVELLFISEDMNASLYLPCTSSHPVNRFVFVVPVRKDFS